MNFYKRDIGKYAKKTAHLSLTEHGAYQALLDIYYATESSLPADLGALYRIAKAMTPVERKAVDKIAAEYFPLNGDGTRHNYMCDETLHAYHEQASTNQRIAVAREAKRKRHEQSTNRATNEQPNSEFRIQSNSKTRAGRGTRLPPDWELPPDWVRWAVTEKPELTGEQVWKIGNKFKDYWIAKAGKDGVKLNWEATWRNWIRDERSEPARAVSQTMKALQNLEELKHAPPLVEKLD